MWLAFAAAVVAVFAAMGWITLTVLRLDAAGAESRRRAELEENVRLALWRMDSALAPLIAAEHARPYAAFRAPAGPPSKGKGPADAAAASIAPSERITPPPLPGRTESFARLYFQFDPDGRLTSPQAVADGGKSAVAARREEIGALKAIAPLPRLLAALPKQPADDDASVPLTDQIAVAQRQAYTQQDESVQANAPARQEQQQQQQSAQVSEPNPQGAQKPQAVASASQGRQQIQTRSPQARRNFEEFNARAGNTARQIQVQNAINEFGPAVTAGMAGDAAVPAGIMQPVWSGEQLLLARRVARPEGEYVQGCWLDWPAVRDWLVGQSADLLPGARLEPVRPDTREPDARLLASLPVRLVPGDAPAPAAAQPSPLRLSLAVAWACVLLASAAVGLLLRGVVSLSERRGAFVSAVTHELRTPLTTLRMYTEMLSEGMVADEDRRRHYLATLRAEADRLGHLVENVLAYSRLERNRAGGGELLTVNLGDALARCTDRLAERTRQAGVRFDVRLEAEATAAMVRTNPTSLEQILLNLVDNACKYGGSAAGSQPVVHLEAARVGERAVLRVRDHGPGLGAARAAKLFHPFSKSVQEAANSAPGLGLGLALSRRLARAMGGDLTLDGAGGLGAGEGASFTVTLPVVEGGG